MFVGLSQAAFAQTPTAGAIAGRVTDEHGALMPNATVYLKCLTRDGLQSYRQTSSDVDGAYTFVGIPFGVYRVVVEPAWVRHTFAKQVELNSSQPIKLDVIVAVPPCFQERFAPAAEKLTDADHSEIIRVLTASRFTGQEKVVMTPVNISPEWFSPQQKLWVTIMKRRAIQGLAENSGSFTYYWFSKPKQIGSCVDIGVLESVAIKGQAEDANMAGGERTYECRKNDGKWTCLFVSAMIS